MSFYSSAIKNPLLATVSNHIDGYPTPINLSYLWGFGSIAGMALVTQIVTGVLLAMHYAPEIHLAFTSVEHIMRDVRGGTILRYIHANGASMFFIVVYLHMFRGLYYGSYFQPRANLWYSGILIFFLMMATGFLGYVLPWGQMSFWGATVITNLFSAIPGIGNSIVQLLWGGFSVDNPTLNRFFSLHYLLPFLIVAVVFLHLILLHQQGSNNPLGISSIFDRIPFYPYFYVKDLFGFLLFVLFFSFFVIYAPNYLGHPDNYIEANPLVTPAHIVPEWYFLPFYAILRTIPDKLGGVVLMGLAIVIIAILPVVDTSAFRSSFFKPLNLWLFWYFFADSVSLGWIGQEIVESPFIEMANFVTLSYFLYFLPLLPFLGFLENASILWGTRYYNVAPKVRSFKKIPLFGFSENTSILRDTGSFSVSKRTLDKPTDPEDVWLFTKISSAMQIISWYDEVKAKESVDLIARTYKYIGDNEERKKAGAIVSDIWSREGNYHPETGEKMVYESEKVEAFLTLLLGFYNNADTNTTEKVALDLFRIIATDCPSYSSGTAFQVSEVLFEILERIKENPKFGKITYVLCLLLVLLDDEDFPNKDKNYPNKHIDLEDFKKAAETFFGVTMCSLPVILPSFFENIGFNLDWLTNFISGTQLFHFFIITLSLLVVASYLPRRVNSLEFLHRLGFGYFFINFVLSTIDRPVRFNSFTEYNVKEILNTFSYVQQDSAIFHFFFIFVSLILLSFFYGTIDKFLLQNGEEIEFPILIVFISSSALILFYVHTLIEFLMALETLTLASYVCAGYERKNRHSSYASVQYFILGSIPSGMLILGLGLLYSQSGVLNFEDLDLVCYNNSSFESNSYLTLIHEEFNLSGESWRRISGLFEYFNNLSSHLTDSKNFAALNNWVSSTTEELTIIRTPAFLAGILFILFNLWFKLTAAPFHFWAVSVYKYAPTPTVTYISIISKAMVIFLLFKFSSVIFQPFNVLLTPLFLSVAVLTVFVGLVGALAEKFVKPFFVYSSMGHVGFMLAGLSLFSATGFSATFHYLGVYILSSFLMWFILIYSGKNTKYLISFKILKKGDPIVALIFAFLIFSMSGIPPLGGFFIKLDVLAAVLENSRYGVNILLFFFTVATFFYYLKINKILFFDDSKEFVKRYALNSERLQLFILLFFFLIFYMFLVQTSLYETGRAFFIESL